MFDRKYINLLVIALSVVALLSFSPIDTAHAYHRLKGRFNFMYKVGLKDSGIQEVQTFRLCIAEIYKPSSNPTSPGNVESVTNQIVAAADKIFHIPTGKTIPPKIVAEHGAIWIVDPLLAKTDPNGPTLFRSGCAQTPGGPVDVVVYLDYGDYFRQGNTSYALSPLNIFDQRPYKERGLVEYPVLGTMRISSYHLTPPLAYALVRILAHETAHLVAGLADTYGPCPGSRLVFLNGQNFYSPHPISLMNWSETITDDDRYGAYQAWSTTLPVGTASLDWLNERVPEFVKLKGFQKINGMWAQDVNLDLISRWNLTDRLYQPMIQLAASYQGDAPLCIPPPAASGVAPSAGASNDVPAGGRRTKD